MSVNRSHVKRLDRIATIRETITNAAEARVRETELRIQELQLDDEGLLGQIELSRADFAYRRSVTGYQIQHYENFIRRLNNQRVVLLQALENAKKNLMQRQLEWTEARREQRIIDRLQERRLLQWQRQEEVSRQKLADDRFIAKFVREKPHDE